MGDGGVGVVGGDGVPVVGCLEVVVGGVGGQGFGQGRGAVGEGGDGEYEDSGELVGGDGGEVGVEEVGRVPDHPGGRDRGVAPGEDGVVDLGDDVGPDRVGHDPVGGGGAEDVGEVGGPVGAQQVGGGGGDGVDGERAEFGFEAPVEAGGNNFDG